MDQADPPENLSLSVSKLSLSDKNQAQDLHEPGRWVQPAQLA